MSVTGDDLLSVIDENPSDDSSWMLYADWLQQKGDPRGELMALDMAIEKAAGADREALAKERGDLLTRAGAQMLGDTLARFLREPYASVTWRRGFITIFAYSGRYTLNYKLQVGWVVKLMLEKPDSFTFLHTLSLPITDIEDLAPLTRFKNLKMLDVSGSNVVDVAALHDMPRLEQVSLHGCHVKEPALAALKKARPSLRVIT
jgi:uncharacterized protein (TIGR02996 family)